MYHTICVSYEAKIGAEAGPKLLLRLLAAPASKPCWQYTVLSSFRSGGLVPVINTVPVHYIMCVWQGGKVSSTPTKSTGPPAFSLRLIEWLFIIFIGKLERKDSPTGSIFFVDKFCTGIIFIKSSTGTGSKHLLISVSDLDS